MFQHWPNLPRSAGQRNNGRRPHAISNEAEADSVYLNARQGCWDGLRRGLCVEQVFVIVVSAHGSRHRAKKQMKAHGLLARRAPGDNASLARSPEVPCRLLAHFHIHWLLFPNLSSLIPIHSRNCDVRSASMESSPKSSHAPTADRMADQNPRKRKLEHEVHALEGGVKKLHVEPNPWTELAEMGWDEKSGKLYGPWKFEG